MPLLPEGPSEVAAEAARALARSKANADESLEIVVLRMSSASANGKAQRPAEARLVRETKELASSQPIEIEERAAPKVRPLDAIADAVLRGYQLMILGAARPARESVLYGRLIDSVVARSAVDTFIVSSSVGFAMESVKRIVVPFTGRDSSRNAADFALTLASGLGASVFALNVARELPIERATALEQLARHRRSIEGALHELEERAKLLEVRFESAIRTAASPSQEILRELREPGYDLCILGATNQSRRGTPFFGDTADVVVRYAPTPVGLLVLKI
ncbi:MAG: universal stress protein [Actinobacteria bacterium]|nr:universal stress protein [Actinomycetota bacterium]